MKVVSYLACLALFVGCNNNGKHDSESVDLSTAKEISDSVNYSKNDTTLKSSRNFSIDLNRQYESENIGIKLMHSHKFKVNSNLQYYLPIILINKTESTVIGVSLRRDHHSDYQELGKFKIKLKPKEAGTINLLSDKLGLNEGELENPFSIGSIVVKGVYYSDGTYSYEKIPHEFR